MAISPQQLTIYLYSAHRAVIFAIAQLSCYYCVRLNMPYSNIKLLTNTRYLNIMTTLTVTDEECYRLKTNKLSDNIVKRWYNFQFPVCNVENTARTDNWQPILSYFCSCVWWVHAAKTKAIPNLWISCKQCEKQNIFIVYHNDTVFHCINQQQRNVIGADRNVITQ